MRRIPLAITTGLEYVLMAFLLLAVVPVLIVFGTAFFVVNRYERLWELMRHDPRHNLSIPEIIDANWDDAYTQKDILTSFKRLSHSLATLSGATAREVHVRTYNAPGSDDNVPTIRQKLVSPYGTAELSLDLDFYSVDGEERATLADDDARAGTAFPPVHIRFTSNTLQMERNFVLESRESVVLFVNLMAGNGRASKCGQLWAFVPDEEVWLVEYKANGQDYGQRSAFSDATARMLWKDEQ